MAAPHSSHLAARRECGRRSSSLRSPRRPPEEAAMSSVPATLCPSAQPDWDDARPFAVVGGTPERPQTAYLDRTQAVSDELLELAAPVTPSEVFRFAAPCAGRACGHFDDGEQRRRLAQKIVRFTPTVVAVLPRCAIRSACSWWQQEGAAACRRCPQVVTDNFLPSAEMREAADPEVR